MHEIASNCISIQCSISLKQSSLNRYSTIVAEFLMRLLVDLRGKRLTLSVLRRNEARNFHMIALYTSNKHRFTSGRPPVQHVRMVTQLFAHLRSLC